LVGIDMVLGGTALTMMALYARLSADTSTLGEFILPHDAARIAADPDKTPR
jgi:hypothetical protein